MCDNYSYGLVYLSAMVTYSAALCGNLKLLLVPQFVFDLCSGLSSNSSMIFGSSSV